jgi:tRNA modification GTPase
MRASPGDTIAAISTPLGPGGIAVVRLSGNHSVEIGDAIFRGRESLSSSPSHTVHHGRIVTSDGCEVDEVLATVMRSPKTYTTEDMVEIACHGGSMPAGRVLEVCLSQGARLARRGEFTLRAFLNGRIDLVQAEAVADIVSARTRKGLEVALGQLTGSLSGELGTLREKLLDFRAEVEATIDFPREDIEPSAVEAIAEIGRSVVWDVDELLRNCDLGAAVRDGISVAIVGRPNVGKSSLSNALLKRDRSIVTPEPGTTRDAIEDCLHIGGIAVTLIDTAGWRDTNDVAERAGVERAKAAASGAALVALVVDASEGIDALDRAIAETLDPERTLVVANKIDGGATVADEALRSLLDRSGRRAKSRDSSVAGAVTAWVSAATGEGLDELRRLLVTRVLGAVHEEESPIVSNSRHIDALRRVRAGVARAVTLLVEGSPSELAAVEIDDAAAALGEITGETTPDEVLDRVFERFCVGK